MINAQLMHFEVHNELLYSNKYELKGEIQEKEIMKKNLNSISNSFEHEYFKMKTNEDY